MLNKSRSPAELRSMFGANLRRMSQDYPSISELARQLGVNRTQFNRYLSGESFPRPDVLDRICNFFEVDARILLEPVERVVATDNSVLLNPAVAEYLGGTARPVPEEVFPSGFYRFTRRSFMDDKAFVQGVIYVFRNRGGTFLKGFEAKDAMRAQGLSVEPRNREFRGTVIPQEDGIAALVSRKGATTTSFNYLAQIPSFQNNYWVGYAARTVRETETGRRVARLVYEYLGRDPASILPAARQAGFCKLEDLPPFHRTQLRPDTPFT